jgi:tetratricopeptide (TPR) repeat protein
MNEGANPRSRFEPGGTEIGTGVSLGSKSSACRLVALILPLLFLQSLGALIVQAQNATTGASTAQALQSYYEAAQTFQENGDFKQASLQFQLFIADALDHLGATRASIGDYAKSSSLFNEALHLAPNNYTIQLDYAEAALGSRDLPRAKLLAEKVVAAEPGDARAHRILGRALLQSGENEPARKELEKAVAIEPDFANGYALASAHLALKDKERAAIIFREMLASFGDKAAVHMQFGLAYGEAGFSEEAIREFRRTIQEDAKFPGAHYSLGASYLLSMGEINFPQAVAEFQKELQANPDDFLSHAQLGYVALNQHRLQDAERELIRAAALNPTAADVFMWLGQLYVETGRMADAEAALRKSIALTSDVSHNHYQVQRAHYLLAHVLLQTNHEEDGKREIQISQELLKLSTPQSQDRTNAMSGNDLGKDVQWRNGKSLAQLDPQALSDAEAAEKQLGPAIADGYNNIGVTAATNRDYAEACDFFEKAGEWNPALDGLDYNWGRAAYSGHLYAEAVVPLARYVRSHADDDAMRSALGISLFVLHDYGRAVQALEPIASRDGASPALAFMYAQALVETGEYGGGIARLRALTANDPQKSLYHRALGEALARRQDYSKATEELRTALQIDSSDSEAKYDLALTLIQLRQTGGAQGLLKEIAQSGSKNPDVYYQLGKLQLEGADAKSAILTLQEAVGLSPGNELIHQALAAAYRQDSRPEDADREMRQAEAIHNSHGSAIESSHQD